MLVNDIYKLALSFVSEKPKADDLQSFIVPWVNLLLAESLSYENNIREYKGQAILSAAPQVTALADTMPYSDEICSPALIYGLTSLIAQDDDNEYRTQRYRDMYIGALGDTQKYIRQDIADSYGGGE